MSADVEKAQMLQRDNASKRALIAQMGAGRRVEGAAGGLGMVMPAATEVCYLKIGRKENCPDGLGVAQAEDGGESGVLPGTPAEGAPAGDGSVGGTAPGTEGTPAPGQGDTGAVQEAAPQPAPAPQPSQPAPSPGGITAGPGGGG